MTREFHFSEGTSNKFWKITVEGSGFTVHYGRIGTAGQVQTKEFASETAAQQAADKLIQEKVKKGYLEQGGDGATAPTPVPKVEPRAKSASAPKAEAAAPASEPEPAAAAPPAEPPLASVSLDAPRSIELPEEALACVTYRRQQRPRPEAPPFDKKDTLARLARIKRSYVNYRYRWDWAAAGIPEASTPEEALFWIEAVCDTSHNRDAKKVAETLAKQQNFTRRSVEATIKRLCESSSPPAEVAKALGSLFSPQEIATGMLAVYHDFQSGSSRRWDVGPHLVTLCAGFGQHVAPYLTDRELEELRGTVRPQVQPQKWPALSQSGYYDSPDIAFFLAAQMGLHEELRVLVEAWPDDAYTNGEGWHDFYHRPQDVLFGLGSPELVEHHFRRLKLRLRTPDYIQAWLAHTGYGALDYVRDTIAGEGNKDEAEKLLKALTCVHAPEAAPIMLELMLTSKAPKVARQWLEENPAHAVAGLVPLVGGRGKLAEAAADYLRVLKRKGGEALIRSAAEQLPQEAQERLNAEVLEYQDAAGDPLDEESTPEWLKTGLAAAAKKKAPTWITAEELPSITVGGRPLNEGQVPGVLAALAASKLEEPEELVRSLKQHADQASLDAFAWRLFERWLAEGAPSKEKWAMQTIGLLGGDASALKLTPLVRAWPGESQHARAVLGLECLRSIGTDTALMQINGIAQKVPFKGIKAKAGECMEAIAQDRGLTRPQLEDRIVPDCGLDERGSRTFDFGPRQFQMVLGPGMKPMVREADGKIRPDLPKPGAKDDAKLAEQAVADWKLLKKQVADVAKVQAVRLEQSMVTGRRWPAAEFEMLLVRHPLMTNLVRLLVWGAYDAEGKLVSSFRVTEDLSYADSTDDVYELDPSLQVGVVHPLHLSEAEKATWGEILGDYEIVPPFQQLGRPVLFLEDGEKKAEILKRWEKIQIPPQSLVFTLEKLDWQRGLPEDGGVFYSHSKPFYGANVTALVVYEEGVPVGYMEGWDDQRIIEAFVIPGVYKPDWYTDHKNKLTLGEVDPVVISEMLADLDFVASKGK